MVKTNTVRTSRDSKLRKQEAEDCFSIAGQSRIHVRGWFEKYAESQGVLLRFRGDCEHANLDDNERCLLQLFLNWISNSLAYNGETSTISVTSDIPCSDQSKGRPDVDVSVPSFMLAVEGDGIGISPMSLARLFYRFCRYERRRIRHAKLTGGFLFAKIALDLKGASIDIESAKSLQDKRVTTRFNFILPGADFSLNDIRDLPANSSHTSDDQFLDKLMSLLECHICDPTFNVSKLVTEIGMSRPVLFRKAKVLTGSSIISLIRSRRLKMAAMLLKQKKAGVSEVAFKVGYSDPKYFSKSFRSEYGKTPKEYVHGLGA